jgi:1,4-dihydroxy-2-naphthoate octaprenyltransferase
MCGARLLGMRTGAKVFTGLLIVLSLCFVAFMVEASVGHDGFLCELGYDKDGDGDGVTGCG